MHPTPLTTGARAPGQAASWGAVLAMSLGAFVLVASEFMPVSLLTPIAADLRISEGQAGQAIAISGAFALLTSLFIGPLAGSMDRKRLLLLMSLLMMVSGAVVAFAPNYLIFMAGRALIGVAIGGFWSMSAAVAMRLVPADQVPRALAILNGGNALATVVAAPLGSFLGAFIGWRGAFFCVVPMAGIAIAWKFASLPPMRGERRAGAGDVFRLMRRPVVALGMVAVGLFFMGQFALFTYLRPFLETVTRVGVSTLSLLLLMLGVAGFAGTTLIGRVLGARLYRTLVVVPLLMALTGMALVAFGHALPVVAGLLLVWGLIGTSAPVAWWTWLAQTLPDDAEAGGGLMVAVVQLAIMLGATVGGLVFDASGYRATFHLSAAILALAAVFTALAARAAAASPR